MSFQGVKNCKGEDSANR